MEIGDSQSLKKFPAPLRSAVDAILQEYKRYQDDRIAWEYEKSELRNRLGELETEAKASDRNRLILSKRVQILEHALKQERLKYQKLLGKLKGAGAKELLEDGDLEKEDESAGMSSPGTGSTLGRSSEKSDEGKSKTVPNMRSVGPLAGGKMVSPGREKLRELLQQMGYRLPDSKGGSGKARDSAESGASDTEETSPVVEKKETTEDSKPKDSKDTKKSKKGDDSDDDSPPSSPKKPEKSVEKPEKKLPPKKSADEDDDSPAEDESIPIIGRTKPSGTVIDREDKDLTIKKPPPPPPKKELVGRSSVDPEPVKPAPTATVPSASKKDEEIFAEQLTIVAKGGIGGVVVGKKKGTGGSRAKLSAFSSEEAASPPGSGSASSESSGTSTMSTMSGSGKMWKQKVALCNHMDAVRCLSFAPETNALLSGSEDGTMKLWNLSTQQDVHTFYGHVGMVTSVLAAESQKICLSAGIDKKIRVWELPETAKDPYSELGSSVKHLLHTYDFHSDIVWDLQCDNGDAGSDQTFFSASADGSIAIFKIRDSDPKVSELKLPSGSIPTSIALHPTSSNRLIVGYRSGVVAIWDIVKEALVQELTFDSDSKNWITKIVSQKGLPLVFAGGSDQSVRFIDAESGEMVHKMLAHASAVSSLCIDSSGTTLISSCHDSSIRFWNIAAKKLEQDLSAHQTHRRKFDEGIHALSFNSTKGTLASGGADCVVKLYVQ